MDVSENLRQMAVRHAPRTAPGLPKRGSTIEIDGVPCTITKSVEIAGRIKAYALDLNGNVRETYL